MTAAFISLLQWAAYLSRLKRQVCEMFENPPLVDDEDGAGRSRVAVVAAAAALDDPHDCQNLAANFRPLALRATALPLSPW